MSGVERRYAEALVEIASENGMLDQYGKELSLICGIYKSLPDFRAFLTSPVIRPDIKRDFLSKILRREISGHLLNFLYLLADNKRMNLIASIHSEYRRQANRLENILDIEIISAEPLDDRQTEKIKSIYGREYGTSGVKAELKIDPSLIGGVMVKIGDKVIDGTIKGRLEQLAVSVNGGSNGNTN